MQRRANLGNATVCWAAPHDHYVVQGVARPNFFVWWVNVARYQHPQVETWGAPLFTEMGT